MFSETEVKRERKKKKLEIGDSQRRVKENERE
jgi:hypothetical protein